MKHLVLGISCMAHIQYHKVLYGICLMYKSPEYRSGTVNLKSFISKDFL